MDRRRPISASRVSARRRSARAVADRRRRSLAMQASHATPPAESQRSSGTRMNILLLGSGGREHALAWKIAASPLVARLCCAPGNAGIARDCEVVALDIADHAAVIAFCKAQNIDLVVVGPEAPLCAGIVDDLTAAGIKAFGPSREAARLEGSKGFAKDLCNASNIPTAAYARFSAAAPAKAYLRARGAPIVVKADGLAAGKGVIIASTIAEAEAAIDMMVGGALGAAGAEVVVEEFLTGEEASFFALCDGETAIALASAQDHKRAFDGDQGPNTGGMGAYSPAPVMTLEMARRAMDEIVLPTVCAMKARGAPYKGVLYAGLMITAKGSLIEGLETAAEVEGVEIFHAGTKVEGGKIFANGGRVLDVCALGTTVSDARSRAYRAVDRIRWPDGVCRRDIGFRAVQREQEGV